MRVFTEGPKGGAVSVNVDVQVNGCCGGERAPMRREPGLVSELAAILLDWIEAGGSVIGALVAELVILVGSGVIGSITGAFSASLWLLKQLLYLLRLGGAVTLWALARAGDGVRRLEQSFGGGPRRLAPVLLPPWMRTEQPSSVETPTVLDVEPVPAQLRGRARHAALLARHRELRLPEGS